MTKEFPVAIDYAELYRQNYEDALDDIHNLKLRIKELEQENARLRCNEDNNNNGNYVLNWYNYLYKNK